MAATTKGAAPEAAQSAGPAVSVPENAIYATFVSNIENATAQRVAQGMATASAQGVTTLHLALQSYGGTVGDGVFLYNIFSALPFDLVLYNAGKVESIATIAFLGAKKRKVSAYATFMIHRTSSSPQFATAGRLQAVAQSLLLDDQRTEAILRKHLRLTEDHWRELDKNDVTFSAKEAVEVGLADEIGEFAPPFGTKLFNV